MGMTTININELFANHLKKTRIAHGYSEEHLSKGMGFENLNQYLKLEDPKKSNPRLSTLQKLSDTFPEINLNGFFRNYHLMLFMQ